MFSKEQKDKAKFILENKHSKFNELQGFEIKDLAVVWCYYSGKIEGNTYTYVETECLLKDGITSPKRYEDAKMLKNLYNTFISVVETIKENGEFEITPFNIKALHSELTQELVENKERGRLRERAVRITGTEYIPPKEEEDIIKGFEQIFKDKDKFKNPLEQAVFLHCNLAKLQPFIDGNERTSRLVESIVMMNNNLIPVFSSKEKDLDNYRSSLIHFYETGDYSRYIDYFLNKQIERINSISTKKEKTYNIEKENKKGSYLDKSFGKREQKRGLKL